MRWLALLAIGLPLPLMAGEGLYDTRDATLHPWLRQHNYLAAPAAPAEDRPVTIVNNGSTPLTCEVTLAHWYVIRPAPVAPGDRVALPFRYEPASGTVSWRNERGDEMAVEGLFCGSDPSARLDFRRLVARSATVSCAQGPGCEPTFGLPQ